MRSLLCRRLDRLVLFYISCIVMPFDGSNPEHTALCIMDGYIGGGQERGAVINDMIIRCVNLDYMLAVVGVALLVPALPS